MMGKSVFRSRSARTPKKETLPFVRNVVSFKHVSFVVWIGDDPNKLFENCFNVTVKKIDKNTDMSGIVKARFLAICYVEVLLPYMIKLINFACEYGVSILWIGSSSPPMRRNWNLTMQLKDPSFFTFWEKVWPLIK